MTLGQDTSVVPSDLIGFVRWATKTTSAKFAAADIKALLNLYYHEFINEILKSGSSMDFNMVTESINLVASTQAYSITGKVLRIKRIEVCLNGSNWHVLTNFDIAERSEPLDSTSIAADFSKDNPFVDVYLDNEAVKVAIYPIPDTNVTNGLKIWKTLEITELSDAANEPSIPEAYQRYIAWGAIRDYFLKKEMSSKAAEAEKEMLKLLARAVSFYANRNEDEKVVLEDGYDNNFCK